jgi:hypothetical protein
MFIQSQFGSREQTGENIESGNWRWRLEIYIEGILYSKVKELEIEYDDS